MIKIENLTFAYPGGEPIFEGFDWRVEAGQSWAVIGPSGCGKTTLLYLLAGLRRPTAGTIIIDGRRVAAPRPGTGLILQDYGLLPWATVWENAALGLKIRSVNGHERRRRVNFWLKRLGIEAVRAHYPGQISGGQRQRTAIARTLALNPDLLLMDEPFSSLDALTREELQNLAVELRTETGTTTIIVTHNIEEAVFLGQHILVLPQPPIRRALVVANPDGGRLNYRDEPAFHQRCNEIRRRMAEVER